MIVGQCDELGAWFCRNFPEKWDLEGGGMGQGFGFLGSCWESGALKANWGICSHIRSLEPAGMHFLKLTDAFLKTNSPVLTVRIPYLAHNDSDIFHSIVMAPYIHYEH